MWAASDLHQATGIASASSDTIQALRKESAKGNAAAKVRLADALMQSADANDADTLNEVCALYREAAAKGEHGAHLGLAKALLLGNTQTKDLKERRQEVMDQLCKASARGSAEADRLLSQLVLITGNRAKDSANAWALLNRAGQRGDATACVELADAYLSGSWNGAKVPVDETEADRLLGVASSQRSPEGALKLSMRVSRKWKDAVPEDYEESVHQLYNALLWSYESGTPLYDEAQKLCDEGKLYPRTWFRARYLYEKTIHPEVVAESAELTKNVEVKVREGVHQQQMIAGASNGPMLTALSFPYDAPYLWDGVVTMTDDGRLAVSTDDLYWPSVAKQLKSGAMPCFVKILDGPYGGLVSYVPADWVPGDDREISLEAAYPQMFTGTTKVALGQWRSLFSMFGQYNHAGLRPGTSTDDADQIILLDSVAQKIERYFFNSELMAWASVDAPNEAIADLALPPWQAMFILRREEAPLYLTVDGVVSGAPASMPIDPGVNLITNMEGRFTDDFGSDASTSTTIRADAFPVFRFDAAEEREELVSVGRENGWWKLLGISAGTPIFMNIPSAFIQSEGEQNVPILLQR